MFGYNFMVTTIRHLTQELDDFANDWLEMAKGFNWCEKQGFAPPEWIYLWTDFDWQ